MIEYVIVAPIAAAAGWLAWQAPYLLGRQTLRWQRFDAAQRAFFKHAGELTRDERTPEMIVNIVGALAQRLDDPWVVRRIVFDALLGRLRRHLEDTSDNDERILSAILEMPDDLRRTFASAMANGLVANALMGGLVGMLFLNLIFPDPKTRDEAASNMASEATVVNALGCAA